LEHEDNKWMGSVRSGICSRNDAVHVRRRWADNVSGNDRSPAQGAGNAGAEDNNGLHPNLGVGHPEADQLFNRRRAHDIDPGSNYRERPDRLTLSGVRLVARRLSAVFGATDRAG